MLKLEFWYTKVARNLSVVPIVCFLGVGEGNVWRKIFLLYSKPISDCLTSTSTTNWAVENGVKPRPIKGVKTKRWGTWALRTTVCVGENQDNWRTSIPCHMSADEWVGRHGSQHSLQKKPCPGGVKSSKFICYGHMMEYKLSLTETPGLLP